MYTYIVIHVYVYVYVDVYVYVYVAERNIVTKYSDRIEKLGNCLLCFELSGVCGASPKGPST